MANGLEITHDKQSEIDVVQLEGSLDGHTFVELEEDLRSAIDQGSKVLLIDLAELSYIASAGVGVFINLQQQLKEQGGGMVLARPGSTVKEVFDLLGLQALFPIHGELDQAQAVAERLAGID